MKSLRRSLNSDKTGKDSSHSVTAPLPGPPSAPIMGGYSAPALSRPSVKVAPPQKVIKATHSYQSTVPQILSYQKGDFYYVTDEYPGDSTHPEGWYGALNPLSNSRGRVPKAHFEEFKKGGRTGGHGHSDSVDSSRAQSPSTFQPYSMSRQPSQAPSLRSNGSSSGSGGMFGHQRQASSVGTMSGMSNQPIGLSGQSNGNGHMVEKKGQPLYAIVQYDFVAERPDELTAKQGEPIIVIAQSNHEWFVAKPIGRLGGPGLIPVSFVEIRDPLTSRPIENVEELLHQGTVPHLDTWKQEAHEYKASAIPLGSFQDLNEARETSRGAPDRQQSGDDGASKTDIFLRDGDVISTHVKSFHYEAEAYWFRINAIFLPDDPDAQAISLVLYRLYEDFYNFQITLLDLFPREAGRGENHRESSNSTATQVSRILPYMPGPLEQVDVDITNTRREDLDTYLRELLDLRNLGAGYILRDDHVLGFFSPGPGDMMENVTRQQAEMMATEVAESQARLGSPGANGTNESGTHENGLEDRLAEMNMGNRYSASTGRGSPMSPSEQAFFGGGGNGNDRTSLNGGTSSNSLGHSRASLNDAGVRGSPASSNNGLPQARGGPSPFSPAVPTGSTTSFGSGSRASGHTVPMPVGSTPPPGQPNGLPVTSATTNGSLVPGGNPAFIKIKILDRNTDDMIAIRVPPRVTYDQLVEKVRDRLVAQVSRLQYRTTGGAEAFRDVTDDRSLMEWLEKEDKLVLYAE